MPIPPRAIPRSTPSSSGPSSSSRPGHSVPHKPRSTLSPTAANALDWRAEVAFLDSYASSSRAWSAPSAGVVIMDAAARKREKTLRAATPVVRGEREVCLEELIQDGKGKREKRATTAATLGFDFIHTPSVLVLPDIDPSSRPSNLTPHRAIPALSPSQFPGRSPSPLSKTPQTPALIASSPASIPAPGSAGPRRTSSEDEDDEELDEWEHVHIADGTDVEGEGEQMMLGHMDLESDMGELDLVDKREAVGMRRVEGLSYAAALGGR